MDINNDFPYCEIILRYKKRQMSFGTVNRMLNELQEYADTFTPKIKVRTEAI